MKILPHLFSKLVITVNMEFIFRQPKGQGYVLQGFALAING